MTITPLVCRWSWLCPTQPYANIYYFKAFSVIASDRNWNKWALVRSRRPDWPSVTTGCVLWVTRLSTERGTRTYLLKAPSLPHTPYPGPLQRWLSFERTLIQRTQIHMHINTQHNAAHDKCVWKSVAGVRRRPIVFANSVERGTAPRPAALVLLFCQKRLQHG